MISFEKDNIEISKSFDFIYIHPFRLCLNGERDILEFGFMDYHLASLLRVVRFGIYITHSLHLLRCKFSLYLEV